MRRITIEERSPGIFRIYNGGALDIVGRTVEDVLRKGLESVGAKTSSEAEGEWLEIRSAHDVAEALESLMGPPQQGIVHEGVVSG